MGTYVPIKRGPVRALYLGVCSAHTNSPSLNFSLREKNNARAFMGLAPRGGSCVSCRRRSALGAALHD